MDLPRLVSEGLRDLILHRHGADAWESIRREVGDGVEEDALAYRLLIAASNELSTPAATLLEDVGRTLATSLEAGDSLPEALDSLEAVWRPLALGSETFDCEPSGQGGYTIRCRGQLNGFGALARGLLRGLGERHGAELLVKAVALRDEGDDEDAFEIEVR